MADPEVVEKIVKLLAQAESTTFDEERKTYLAKAAALMSQHQIDQATIDGARENPEAPGWDAWPYSADGRYLPGKRLLITLACEIAGGGTTGGFIDSPPDGGEWAALVGFPVERAVARLAYESLVRMVLDEAAERALTQERIVNSFVIGFASALHDKLRLQRIEQRRVTRSENPQALVLIDQRARKVADEMPTREAVPVDWDDVDRGVFEHGRAVGMTADVDLGGRTRLDTGG